MDYNLKITDYGKEIQVTFYDYYIRQGKEVTEDVKARQQHFKANNKSYLSNLESDNSIDEEVRRQVSRKIGENQKRSARRSKQSIYEIARANIWEWFATFTFADDRYDYDLCKKRLMKYFNNLKNRYCDDFEYLCVPERHKDGAWHFHALLIGNLEPYCHSKGWNKDKYVLSSYNFGICELERVKDTYKVASYVTKYITKDVVKDMGGKSRYFHSRGLNKPNNKVVNTNDTLYEFICKYYPEYDVQHINKVSYGSNTIQYVQLKEKK